jgi:signal transduction histidine kinase
MAPQNALSSNAAVLQRLGLANHHPLPVYQRLARLAATVTGFPVGLVSLVAAEGQWNKGRWGLERGFLDMTSALCPHFLPAEGPVVLPDVSADPRLGGNLLVQQAPNVRAYAASPLRHAGLPMGMVCVLDVRPHAPSPEAVAALDDIAAAASLVLDNLAHQHELEQERERAVDFASASGDWFWELDARLHYTWVSPNVHEHTGMDQAQLIAWPIGEAPVLTRFPDEPPSRLVDILQQRQSFAGISVEMPIRGRPCVVALNGRALFDEEGHFTGYRGTARDVTEVVAMARAAEHEAMEREKALRANEAKSAFLSRASHELRTPLNAIMGFTQLMELEDAPALPEKVQQRLRIVRQGAEHLLDLVNDVLDLSKLEIGDGLQREVVALAPVVDECCAMLAVDAARRGVQVTWEVMPGAEQVCAAPTALRRVLLNLLSNAVKYNRDQGRVDVVAQPEGERVQVCVRDTGQGIASALHSRLFRPFDRLGAERTKVAGSGLGLLVARSLARAMEGELAVDSQEGVGTTAWLTLKRP